AGPARARDAARAPADHEQIEIRQARRSPLALPRTATAPGLAAPAEEFNRFGAAAAARSADRLQPDLLHGLAQLVEAGVVVVRHARLIALFGEIRGRFLRVLAGLGAFQRIAELLRQGRAVDAFSDVDLLRQRRSAEARRRQREHRQASHRDPPLATLPRPVWRSLEPATRRSRIAARCARDRGRLRTRLGPVGDGPALMPDGAGPARPAPRAALSCRSAVDSPPWPS